MTDGQLQIAVNTGVAGLQLVASIIETIIADVGLSEAQKQAAIAEIHANLPEKRAQVKADAAHVRAEDPIPDPAPTAR